MKRYLRLYQRILTLNLHLVQAYPADFWSHVFSSLLWGAFSILAIFLISSKASSVAGWNQAGMLLLGSGYGIVVGMFHVLFTGSFYRISRLINKGELDGYFLKPISPLWLVTSVNLNLGGLVRFVVSIVFTAILMSHFRLTTSPIFIVGFMTSSVAAVLLLYSLFAIASTLLIWYPNLSNLMDFMTSIMGTGRYPKDIVSNTAIPALIFLPFLLTVNVPVKILLGKIDLHEILLFFGLALFAWLSCRWLWKFATRYYTSAGG